MLLQVLRAFKCLTTKVTFVRFEGDMNSNVRGDMITLDSSCIAIIPRAGQSQIISALASDMPLTHMFLLAVS